MDDINENCLVMYEESKEIKETIWKAWDLLNDKEIINKIIINSSLMNEIGKLRDQENKARDKTNNNSLINDKLEKNSNYILINNIIIYKYRYFNKFRRYSISISFKNNIL